MFAGRDLKDEPSSLRRWRVNTGGAALTFREDTVTDLQYELPTHDRRFTGRPHRHGWFVDTRPDPNTVNLGGIGHFDFSTGRASVWDPGPVRHADEAFFVPGGSGEGEGFLLTFVYDHMSAESVLAILDAQAVAKGPIAEVTLPRRVPHGFHAVWIPA
jgi:carotenoid cleavage dioxygenase